MNYFKQNFEFWGHILEKHVYVLNKLSTYFIHVEFAWQYKVYSFISFQNLSVSLSFSLLLSYTMYYTIKLSKSAYHTVPGKIFWRSIQGETQRSTQPNNVTSFGFTMQCCQLGVFVARSTKFLKPFSAFSSQSTLRQIEHLFRQIYLL